MKKQFNSTEIAQVDSWIKQRGYVYEDVRVEILDHVLSAMQDLMTNNAQLSLQQAYDQVHASFGIFGFSTLEESFIRSTEKRIWRKVAEQLLSFIKPKGVLFSLSLILLLVAMYTTLGSYAVAIFPLLLSLTFIVGRIRIYRREKQLQKQLSFRMSLGTLVLTLPITTQIFVWLPEFASGYGWLVPLIASLFCLLEWAQWQVLQAELDKHRQLCQKIGLA